MFLSGLLTKQLEKLPVSRGSPHSPPKPAIQTKLPLSAPKHTADINPARRHTTTPTHENKMGTFHSNTATA